MQKRILIINTGGTLSSVNGSNGLVPGMNSGDMLEELRMVSKNLELEAEDFCSLDSSNIGPEDWTGLAKLIAERSYDYHGIYIRESVRRYWICTMKKVTRLFISKDLIWVGCLL